LRSFENQLLVYINQGRQKKNDLLQNISEFVRMYRQRNKNNNQPFWFLSNNKCINVSPVWFPYQCSDMDHPCSWQDYMYIQEQSLWGKAGVWVWRKAWLQHASFEQWQNKGRLVVIRGLYDLLSWGLLYIILDIPCPTSKFKTMTKGIWTLLTWWFLNIWIPKSNICHFSGSRFPKFEKHLVKCGLCLLAVGPHQLVRSFHVYTYMDIFHL